MYQDIELPLVYSLYRMEQAGILVKGEALKEYGERLADGIHTLEQQVYELTGENVQHQFPQSSWVRYCLEK